MADMDGLKKRVELIDLRLKSAHSARERESAALMEIWQQIRDRFEEQNAEIAALRGQVAELEDSRDDLLNMVHSLLSAVEGGLDTTADETVPKIKQLAGQLLADNKDLVEPIRSPGSPAESDIESGSPGTSLPDSSFHDELLNEIERTIEAVNEEDDDYDDFDDYLEENSLSISRDETADLDKNVPASPGIRNLVARIENAVGEDFFEPSSTKNDDETEDDDDLSRDLREIEALRDELHGLRHRISAGAN